MLEELALNDIENVQSFLGFVNLRKERAKELLEEDGCTKPEPKWGEYANDFFERVVDIRKQVEKNFKVSFNGTEINVTDEDNAMSLFWKWKYLREKEY